MQTLKQKQAQLAKHEKADLAAHKVIAADKASILDSSTTAEEATSNVKKQYHFTRIKAKGSTQIKVGKGVLRHIVFNAPEIVAPDITFIDGVSANDAQLTVDMDKVILPGKAQPNERVNHYVIEYHVPFQNGLRVNLQVDRDITVVWE